MRKYTFTATDDDTQFCLSSESDGFNGLEILGLLSMKMHDIRAQLSGEEHPEIKYKRTVLVDAPMDTPIQSGQEG
jgi:hypothetical protein